MTRQLVVEILSDAKKFDQGFDKADKTINEFEGSSRKASETTSKFTGRVDALNKKMANLAKLAAGIAIAKFGADAIRAASALDESINAVQKTFGDASEQILAFGRVSAQVTGLSNREFNELATNTGALLTNMGFGFSDAGDEAIRLTRRASDLASVFNTDVSEALNAINSALRGESEPIRRFGVSLSDAAVRAKAVELGLADTTAAVGDHEKAVARLNIIYEQSEKVAGDFLQTSNSLANAQRRAAGILEDSQAGFGAAATPLFAAGLTGAAKALLSFRLLLSPLTGDVDRVALAQLRFGEATEYLIDRITSGEDEMDALADATLFLADAGVLTRDEFAALASVVGLAEEDFDAFGRTMVARLVEMGAAPSVINAVRSSLLDVQGPFLDAGNAAGEGAAGAAEFAAEMAKIRENVEKIVAARTEFAAFLGLFGSTKASRDSAIIGLANPELQGTSVEAILRSKSIAEGLFGEAPGIKFEDTEAGQQLNDDLTTGFETMFDQATAAGFERMAGFDDFRVYDTFVRYGITARRAFEFGFTPTLFPGGFPTTVFPPGGNSSSSTTFGGDTINVYPQGDGIQTVRELERTLDRRKRAGVDN